VDKFQYTISFRKYRRKIFHLLLVLLQGPVLISLFPLPAGASSPSIDTLRREIVILDRARRNVAAHLEKDHGTRYSSKISGQYRQYLDSRIAELCSQALSIDGLSAIAGLPCPPPHSMLPGYQVPAAESSEQRLRAIDQQLLESLGNFDELLAAEQQKVMAKRPEAAGSAPGEPGAQNKRSGDRSGSAGGGSGGMQGSSSDSRPGSQQGQGGYEQGGMQGNDSAGQQEGEYQGKTARSGMPGMHGEPGSMGKENGQRGEGQAQRGSTGRQPGTVAGGGPGVTDKEGGPSIYADDDIVARQLREAAEKETDPELKKKLWEEYRRYKEANR
jgi:hypothetical protein